MRKMVFAAALVLAFFLTSTAFADYVIKLKNGGSVKTSNYWKEKEEIKFQYKGGVASLPSKDITSIEEVAGEPSENVEKQKEQASTAGEVVVEAKKAPPPEVEKATPAEASQETDVQKKDKKGLDPESYKKEKAYYMEQYEQAYQRYLDATSRRDKEAKEKAWEEFNRYGGKVVSMEPELRKTNNGEVPPWWKE